MAGYVRQARTEQGVSMGELATRLGIGVQAVSTLELNDQKGTIKVETRERALAALGKRSVTVVVDAVTDEQLAAAEIRARALVERVAWTMGLEGQNLTGGAIEELVHEAIAEELADL
jgi:transcriptional regulator with XRE-family HTH domain